ncbi:MAG: LacI family DNA-binding transcriptional regulator [Sphaerochaeta sp.]|uniref:LacI family DNA-binding transcriptional regulator n=1 Tax=Sphaerochaeta sp. TaxID=1972642 RepID=UPI002FCC6AE9
MNTKDVTITDVAAMAGVSIATVSRVINNSLRVDPVVRQKVHEAIEQLGYVTPIKKHAQNLWALIVPSLQNPFFSLVAEGVLARANEAKQNLVVYSSNGSAEQEALCLQQAAQLGVSALLFCPISDASLSFLPRDVAVLIVYRRAYQKGGVHIYYDNELGGYLATKYLLRGNHRHIAFFASFWQPQTIEKHQMLRDLDSDMKRGSYSSLDRLAGYRKALSEFSLELDPDLVWVAGYDFSSGYTQAKAFLSTLKDFDAILCCNDSVASGVLQALQEQHINVPEQVSILGYDDSFLSEVARPELSSIRQDPLLLGRQAVDLLTQRLSGRPVGDVVLKPTLTIRNSSRMRTNETGTPEKN